MEHNKKKVGQPYAVRASANEQYEIDHLEREFGTTTESIRAAIRKVGLSRDRIRDEIKHPKR